MNKEELKQEWEKLQMFQATSLSFNQFLEYKGFKLLDDALSTGSNQGSIESQGTKSI